MGVSSLLSFSQSEVGIKVLCCAVVKGFFEEWGWPIPDGEFPSYINACQMRRVKERERTAATVHEDGRRN